jgi:hypothetical protein
MTPPEERDIGQRSSRHQGDRIGTGAYGLRDELDCIKWVRPYGRDGQIRAFEAAAAMDVRSRFERTAQWGGGTHGDRYICPAKQREHAQGVARRVLERGVAADGGDPENSNLRSSERERDGQGIVVPGIAIDDDRTWVGRPLRQARASLS